MNTLLLKVHHKVIAEICRRISTSGSIDETQWEAAMAEYNKSNNSISTNDFEEQFFAVISEDILCSSRTILRELSMSLQLYQSFS